MTTTHVRTAEDMGLLVNSRSLGNVCHIHINQNVNVQEIMEFVYHQLVASRSEPHTQRKTTRLVSC